MRLIHLAAPVGLMVVSPCAALWISLA